MATVNCEQAVIHGDSRNMEGLADSTADLMCTDPPYGMNFMGKDWDKALPDIAIWKECLRVLKPGAFAFVMSIPRADCLSRMIISLEDAGFWVNFSPIYWAYASGFPKAQNIGKAVDKRNGRVVFPEVREYLNEQRKQIGLSLAQVNERLGTAGGGTASSLMGDKRFNELPTVEIYNKLKDLLDLDNRFDELIEREEAEREVVGHSSNKIHLENLGQAGYKEELDLTMSATPQAKALDGSYGGFQPKPALEVIIVAMKPLSEKTFVDQALKNGKGITWLDDCRVPYEDGQNRETVSESSTDAFNDNWKPQQGHTVSTGRFPANLIISDDVLNDGRTTRGTGTPRHNNKGDTTNWRMARQEHISYGYPDSGSFSRYFSLDKWFTEKIKELPESVQKTYPFLIVPKASKAEKNGGCEELYWWNSELIPRGLYEVLEKMNESLAPKGKHRISNGNIHPTVKPIKLMSYLVTLGSRAGDLVVDPFGGTMTTGISCKILDRSFYGYESNFGAWKTGTCRMGQPI